MGEEDLVGIFKGIFEKSETAASTSESGSFRVDRDLIPGYEVLDYLGKGGMGVVVKARQLSLDRLVAIKLLKPELSQDREYVQRFLSEARTAGKLRHLNLVSALDCGSVEDFRFMVMELVEGRSLDAVLKERGMLDERVALEIVKQVAEGLDYAWKHEIIHRDIKPQNIMMTGEGVAKICDLGLAKSVSRDHHLTSTGYVNCTPTHASPEQARGERTLDCRTDIYSLGVTLYQLVTGALPFEGSSPADIFVKHATWPRPLASDRNPRVSKRVNALIQSMMDPDPARRPSTPGAVVEAIRKILGSPREDRTASPGVPERKAGQSVHAALKAAGMQVKSAWTLDVTMRGKCAVVSLAGRLDDSFEHDMTRHLQKIIEMKIPSIIVDLAGLTYMNSRGVSVFIAAIDEVRAMGGDLKLAGAKPQAKLVLERLGISLIMQHLTSVDEAIEAFASTPVYEPEPPKEVEAVVEVPSVPEVAWQSMAPEGDADPLPPAVPAPPELKATISAPAVAPEAAVKPPTARKEADRSGSDRPPATSLRLRLVSIALSAVSCAALILLIALRVEKPKPTSALLFGEQLLKARSLNASGPNNMFKLEAIGGGGQAWLSTKRVEPWNALGNFVEGEFRASPEMAYKAWAYLGLRSKESGVVFYQTSEGIVLRDGKKSGIGPGEGNAGTIDLPPNFATRSHDGWRWGWVAIPLPESYAQPGLKTIRILTDRPEVAVRALLVSSSRDQIPDEETARSIDLIRD